MFIRKISLVLMTFVLAATWLTCPAGASPAGASPAGASPAFTLGADAQPPGGPCTGPYTSEWVQQSNGQWWLEEVATFCTPIVMWQCYFSNLLACQMTYDVLHTKMVRSSPIAGQGKCICLIQPTGPNGTGVLSQERKGLVEVGVLGMGSDATAGAVSSALDSRTGAIYSSITDPSGIAAVYVYAAGSTEPTKGNVFWAFDDAYGNGYVDEFVGGQGNPRRLNLKIDGAAGDIQFDCRVDLLVASPATSTIHIYSYAGKPISALVTTGYMTSMDLDAKNQYLYVADVANNLIDQYAYPSGALVSSEPPAAINGVTPQMQTVAASL